MFRTTAYHIVIIPYHDKTFFTAQAYIVTTEVRQIGWEGRRGEARRVEGEGGEEGGKIELKTMFL